MANQHTAALPTDEAIVEAFKRLGSKAAVARELGCHRHTVAEIILREGISTPVVQWTYPRVLHRDILDGVIIAGSDHHVWPGPDTTAYKAMLEVTSSLSGSVKGLVANGDWLDGASTNRHDPPGFSDRPRAKEELDCVIDTLHRWRMAAKPARSKVDCYYTIGNHELNFERGLAKRAKEYQGLMGLRLADHFHDWELAWSLFLNREQPQPVMIKHRHVGGIHAGYNNTLKAGVTMVTGHTHILEVKPWGDYRGRRYGIQTGCLADPEGAQFEYGENGPAPHCPGFAVLTFKNGQLLPPELAEVIEGKCYFRGQVVIDDSDAWKLENDR